MYEEYYSNEIMVRTVDNGEVYQIYFISDANDKQVYFELRKNYEKIDSDTNFAILNKKLDDILSMIH